MSEENKTSVPEGTTIVMKKSSLGHFISPLVSAVIVLAGVFAVYTLIRDAKRDHMELVAALSRNTQEVTLLKVIDDRVKAPMETKVEMTRTILSLGQLKRFDPALICGIIEVETGGTWKTDQVSPSGAVGIMQLMPATGKVYLRAERIDPTTKALADPVSNIMCGIMALADFRDQAQDMGLEKPGEMAIALAMYNMGPRAREATTYSKAVLAATKKFKELGL